MHDEASEDEMAGYPNHNSVHVGILITASPGYSRAGPPHCILGFTLETFSKTFWWGKIYLWHKLLEISSLESMATIRQPISGLQAGSSSQGLVEGLDPIRLGPFLRGFKEAGAL